MLYGLSNILKRKTREGRQESRNADQEGTALRLSDSLAAAQEVILRCDRAFLLCEGVGFLPVPRRVPCPRALCVICWRLPPTESQPRRSA